VIVASAIGRHHCQIIASAQSGLPCQ